MNKEEIREELIRILKGSNSNGYMWYYDADSYDIEHRGGFPVFDSLLTLINKLPGKPYVHDHYEKLPKENH